MSNFINLSKGETISLTKMPAIDLSKGGKGLREVVVGLGWDPAMVEKKGIFGVRKVAGPSVDCDAFALLIKNGRLENSKDIIYFNNLRHSSNSIWHTGDNLTGDGDGDDEQIIANLSKLNCDKVVIGVNIYNGKSKGQHFGMLQNAFVRIVDKENNQELCHYTLDSKYNGAVSIIFGELVRVGNDWDFRAVGETVNANTIGEVASFYK